MAVDPGLPRLHIRPAQGWLNDPNGACLVDGTWHVFFQYRPDSPVHGQICWGHVSSPDILHWIEHPIALTPRPGGPDAAGCWSGCVVDDGGVPTAVYTAIAGEAADATVVLARSDRRLLHWEQDRDPVAGVPTGLGVTEVRDPFVFEHNGRRYAVQGAGSVGGPPSLVLHECDDLRWWQERGTLLVGDDPVAAPLAPADIWECPSLVRIGVDWVLVLSLWRRREGYDELAGSRWFVGELLDEPVGPRFVPVAGGVFDTGPAGYAPHLVAADGRVLAWGWARETARTGEEILRSGWAGALTFPREVTLRDGRVAMAPAAELVGLRAERLERGPGEPVGVPAFEVVARGRVRLLLDDEEVVDVTGSAEEPARVLVDGDLVEAFARGTAHTTRARPDAHHAWMVTAEPGTTDLFRLALPAPPTG